MSVKGLLGAVVLGGGLLLSGCGGGAPTPTAPAAPAGTPTVAAAGPTNTAEVLAPATPGSGGAPNVTAPPATPPAAPPATATEAAQPAGTAPGGGPLTKVTLALDWTPNTNHTGFYVAQQQGWYAAQGLDLQILPYSDAASPDTLVAAGKADFGISFVEQLVIDRATGLPVKSVAAIVQHNTSELATLKTSGLDRPRKLAGTRYAGFGTPYEEPVIAMMIQCDGGASGAIQNITTNTGGLQAIESKQADFVWIYQGWEAIQARHDGFELNEFLVKDFCVPDYPSPVIIASEDFVQTQGDLGRRFLAATAQGYEYAIQHPDAAADILIAANPPETFPDKALVHESAQYLAGQYKAEAPHWGVQSLRQWTGYPQFMVGTGKLEDANHQPVTQLDYASLFTNELIPVK